MDRLSHPTGTSAFRVQGKVIRRSYTTSARHPFQSTFGNCRRQAASRMATAARALSIFMAMLLSVFSFQFSVFSFQFSAVFQHSSFDACSLLRDHDQVDACPPVVGLEVVVAVELHLARPGSEGGLPQRFHFEGEQGRRLSWPGRRRAARQPRWTKPRSPARTPLTTSDFPCSTSRRGISANGPGRRPDAEG